MENQSETPPQPQKWYRNKQVLTGLAVALAGLIVILLAVLLIDRRPATDKSNSNQTAKVVDESQSSQPVEEIFYKTIETAATKQIVHFTHSQKKYALTDSARTTPIGQLYSTAEYNSAGGDYRAVYAYSPADAIEKPLPFTDIVRCLNGKAYRPARDEASTNKPQTVEQVKEALNTTFVEAPGEGSSFCSVKDLNRRGRLTDSIIPFGLSQEQATAWVNQLRTDKVFELTDAGTAEHDGKKLRKIHVAMRFKPNGTDRIPIVDQLYAALKVAGITPLGDNFYKVDKLEQTLSAPIIEGDYLVSTKTNLPIYSELRGLPVPGTNPEEEPWFRPATTKQEYGFPGALSLTRTTPLDILE